MGSLETPRCAVPYQRAEGLTRSSAGLSGGRSCLTIWDEWRSMFAWASPRGSKLPSSERGGGVGSII